jgi:mutual gliding-motility protein MglA
VVDPKGEYQAFEGIADKGVGVFETLRSVSKQVLEKLAQGK